MSVYALILIVLNCRNNDMLLKICSKSKTKTKHLVKRENKNNFRIYFIDESILFFDYCLDTYAQELLWKPVSTNNLTIMGSS